jgi:hypothetical protein
MRDGGGPAPILLNIGSSEILKGLFIFPLSILIFPGGPPPPPWGAWPGKRESLLCKLYPEIPQVRKRKVVPHDTEEGSIIRVNGQHSLGFDPHSRRLTREVIGIEQGGVSESTPWRQIDTAVCRLNNAIHEMCALFDIIGFRAVGPGPKHSNRSLHRERALRASALVCQRIKKV